MNKTVVAVEGGEREVVWEKAGWWLGGGDDFVDVFWCG